MDASAVSDVRAAKAQRAGEGSPESLAEKTRTCGLCGGPASTFFEGPPAVLSCASCGLTALAEIPAPSEREALYQENYHGPRRGERFFAPFEGALSLLKRARMRAILKRVPGPSSILDVGCGRGDLLELFQRRGWRAVGTQISRTAAEAARSTRGVQVLVGELPELSLDGERFAVITFFHVLEHVARPDAYLETARRLLSDGGLLVVEVPNCGGIGFRWLRDRHLCFDYPHHLVFFTEKSLERLLRRCGFEVDRVSRFSLEYSPFTTLQNMLNLLPGKPNRLYKALQRNPEGARLRREPLTILHAGLACLLAPLALAASALPPAFSGGNTMRFYCRPVP